jgi:hypothetical protein
MGVCRAESRRRARMEKQIFRDYPITRYQYNRRPLGSGLFRNHQPFGGQDASGKFPNFRLLKGRVIRKTLPKRSSVSRALRLFEMVPEPRTSRMGVFLNNQREQECDNCEYSTITKVTGFYPTSLSLPLMRVWPKSLLVYRESSKSSSWSDRDADRAPMHATCRG